jgi:NAD(P)-dependent dehydrogenase (short-subunit alcohol dehydrogenase family)
MGRREGNVALITGTGGGQGRAAALLFAAEGATVVGCDLKTDGASETVHAVRAAGGRMDSTHPLDLTDEAAMRGWVDDAAALHGRLDVLYNNAGATRFDPIEVESYRTGTSRSATNSTWSSWPPSTPGRTSSDGVDRSSSSPPPPGSCAASTPPPKAASSRWRPEGAWHGIRVNCVSPGVIMTPATQYDILGDPTHPMYRIRDHIPLGRIGAADDIAPAALLLASDESAYMTGANLVIDGGWSIVLPGAPPRPRT